MKKRHWIDNADSFVCPNCGYETSSPLNHPLTERGNTQCPNCCWEADDANLPAVINFVNSKHSTNAVNHPSHYNKGSIEVWDFISDWGLNFDRGNAIKYLCRAGEKDPTKEIQDLEKAIAYIEHEIKILKGEIENA